MSQEMKEMAIVFYKLPVLHMNWYTVFEGGYKLFKNIHHKP